MVQKGQPLCIVEAMKMMNEIESDTAGRLVRILVENGQPVEYGQPLMIDREGRCRVCRESRWVSMRPWRGLCRAGRTTKLTAKMVLTIE